MTENDARAATSRAARASVVELRMRRLRSAADLLDDAIVITSARGEIDVVNVAAARLLGATPAFLRGKPAHERLPGALAALIADVALLGSAGARRESLELSFDGGAPRPFTTSVAPVSGACGGVDAVVAILRDEADRVERERDHAERVSQLSHELRTPLSSIRAYAEMLLDGEFAGADTRRECHAIIQEEAAHLARLLDNLLSIGSIESGAAPATSERVVLDEVIERAIRTLAPHAREREIEVRARRAHPGIAVAGDGDMLVQVVVNLLSNAVKYTPRGGHVSIAVSVDRRRGAALVEVVDTGAGIPGDALDRVFGKFCRLAPHRSMARGAGLGLNLCKHIVENVHGGHIGVESALGEGSRFWFTIPLRGVEARTDPSVGAREGDR